MKNILVFAAVLFFSTGTFAQDITGTWSGTLDVSSIKIRLVFNIKKTAEGYSSTFDSPDQGAKDLPVASTRFENSILKLDLPNFGIQYAGELKADGTIAGTFKQGVTETKLNLTRGEVAAPARPQEPKPPYPYYSEEVRFDNSGAKIRLAGTLTLPQKDGVFPVVVLITGSGAQNRNEELLGHKPFLVLSDYLTRNGFGVLRFDDRGVGESQGDYAKATSEDLATDAEAAVAYLKTRKEINKNKIGLMGHSEGGVIAPMIAARSKDIAFIVLLAGTGLPGDKILLLQKELIERAAGIPEAGIQSGQKLLKPAYELIRSSTNPAEVEEKLKLYFKENGLNESDSLQYSKQLSSPWMQFFIKYDPAPALKKVRCPVLALNGENDLQVPAKANLDAISQALLSGGNKHVTVKMFPKLNHLFQESATGSPSEYKSIEQTFSPVALSEIVKWLQLNTK